MLVGWVKDAVLGRSVFVFTVYRPATLQNGGMPCWLRLSIVETESLGDVFFGLLVEHFPEGPYGHGDSFGIHDCVEPVGGEAINGAIAPKQTVPVHDKAVTC